MLNELKTAYNNYAYTHHYIIGCTYHKKVYFAFKEWNELDASIVLETASKNEGSCIKFRPSAAQKAAIACDACELCDEADFEAMFKASKYNRGEIFEELIFERYGQSWNKDAVPFTDAGDIVIDGVHYQIKFQKARFCTEKQIRRLEEG